MEIGAGMISERELNIFYVHTSLMEVCMHGNATRIIRVCVYGIK